MGGKGRKVGKGGGFSRQERIFPLRAPFLCAEPSSLEVPPQDSMRYASPLQYKDLANCFLTLEEAARKEDSEVRSSPLVEFWSRTGGRRSHSRSQAVSGLSAPIAPED